MVEWIALMFMHSMALGFQTDLVKLSGAPLSTVKHNYM